MSVLEKHPVLALAAGALALAAVAGTGVAALSMTGAPLAYQRPAAVGGRTVGQTAPEAVIARIKDSPAESVLAKMLDSPPKGFKPTGIVQRAAVPPVPFSCPAAGTAPAVSVSRLFSVEGKRIQVVLAAYRAGQGAEVLQEQLDHAGSCADDGITVVEAGIEGRDPGIEAYRVFAYQGQAASQVLAVRRGDVLAFYVGDEAAPLVELARGFDRALARRLEPVCADQKSTVADARRNPWSGEGYQPYAVRTAVAVRDMSLPQQPAGSDVLMVQLPGPEIKIKKVEPTMQPWYPVWPAMPEPMEFPEPPESPDPGADTEQAVRILAEDKTGPGCGWAFTGMSGVPFDEAAAARTNAERTSKALVSLAKGQQQWQQDVLDYWKEYGTYKEKALKYKKYAAQVRKVNAAWADIEGDWNEYWARYAQYQSALAEHNRFLADQAVARTSYSKALDRCAKENEEVLEEAEEAEEDEEAPETVDCQDTVDWPAILSRTAPEVPAEPVPPADPRPEDAR
ncbi:hypothetical protein [Arthrobacter mobilis]|uniref:Uncharacterized protein n=1 Tax=Arthrobacter mobilis TaxID=2724944 RepID=A0A7X6HAI0_9MICC|nr:hypothetical protein [Arthrobacter mobilis]NKX53503.1 hypothetical protein [Arthrobacter mobilis]